MRTRRTIVVERMTHDQLYNRLYSIASELDMGVKDQGDYARLKMIPSELRAIAAELRLRGDQLRFY